MRGLIAERDGGSVGAAAKRVGISQPSLHYIVRGQNWPSVESLAKLAGAYGVSADWLLGLSSERQPVSGDVGTVRRQLAGRLRELATEVEAPGVPDGNHDGGTAAHDDFPPTESDLVTGDAPAAESAGRHRRKKAG